jgi:hypothetical protein
MSTAAVSSGSIQQQLQQYFQTRSTDLQQLGQALTSGSLSDAQTAYNSIVSLGQGGPFAGGNPFKPSASRTSPPSDKLCNRETWPGHSKPSARSKPHFKALRPVDQGVGSPRLLWPVLPPAAAPKLSST